MKKLHVKAIEGTEKGNANFDELISILVKVDYMRYLIQNMQEHFFEAYDADNEEDVKWIAWEFNRNRAYTAIISNALCTIQEQLEKLNLSRNSYL